LPIVADLCTVSQQAAFLQVNLVPRDKQSKFRNGTLKNKLIRRVAVPLAGDFI
jgi:hypothetical protein